VPSGKIYEYLAAERPILAAVPTGGAAAELVREAAAGLVVPPDDVEAIEGALHDLHSRWRGGTLDGVALSPAMRKQLDRKQRAEELARVLRSIT
jgi:glycosyltransferase involved in cell wall biosynthesis